MEAPLKQVSLNGTFWDPPSDAIGAFAKIVIVDGGATGGNATGCPTFVCGTGGTGGTLKIKYFRIPAGRIPIQIGGSDTVSWFYSPTMQVDAGYGGQGGSPGGSGVGCSGGAGGNGGTEPGFGGGYQMMTLTKTNFFGFPMGTFFTGAAVTGGQGGSINICGVPTPPSPGTAGGILVIYTPSTLRINIV